MWRRTSRDRFVIIGLVLATIAVLTLDYRTGLVDGLSNATSQVVGVFQAGVRTVVRPVQGAVDAVADFGDLREENARLRRENEVLRRQGETYTNLARENARMRQLLQLSSSLGLETLSARVIGSSLSGLERSALLDKGRDDGIVDDAPVLGPEGLVGRISWVGRRTSKVLLLIDSQSAVGVRIGETGEVGILEGTGEDDLRLELVSLEALNEGAIKRGDVVLTSGQEGGIFPPGVPIGRIEEVSQTERGNAYSIEVAPFAEFTRLDILSIVVGQEEIIEAPPTPRPGPASPSPSPMEELGTEEEG